jgi:octanoyl-[GcvH]:protein N-octanoyltransferase
MSRPPLRLIRESFSSEPAVDTAVSRALLLRASDGQIPETFRLHVAGRVVAFGKRDTLEPGYPDAVDVSVRRGFAPIERLAGGRAAVFTPSTLSFTWTVPDADPRSGIYERFADLSAVMVGAFARLGVPSEVGEIPGEYCPGDYSVHHAGRIKLMGVGQRLARNAAHVGGVVVVDRSAEVREMLVAVYRALGLDWDPSTAGALTDVVPDLSAVSVADAIVAEWEERRDVSPASLAAETVALARQLAPEHMAGAKY